MYDPAKIPAISGETRRGVFRSHLHRRPVTATYRTKTYTVAQTTPSAARKMSLAGFTEEVADLEIMIALDAGDAAPVPLGADAVVIGAKTYRIISAQSDIGTDCYQLSLSLRR